MIRQRDIRLVVSTFMAVAVALLLPCFSTAGSIEPTPDAVDTSGNPVPTMKTLDEVLPAWSQRLRADDGGPDGCNSSRFKCVLNGEAVLDKETGLVWEREPYNGEGDWWGAHWRCRSAGPLNHGGRRGWRLPTIDEFESLWEYCPSAETRHLPCGHPFINVNAYASYWTATSFIFDSNKAYTSSPYYGMDVPEKTWTHGYNWCVRGGFGVNYEGY